MSCTSKQRVEMIFNKQLPDRPAIGFFAIDSDTAAGVLGRQTYWRAKAKSQIAFWQGRRDEVVQSWIEDGIELYKKLDFIDIIPVCCESAGICPPKGYTPESPKQIDETTWQGKDGKIYRYSPTTKDITVISSPFVEDSLELQAEMWDGVITPPDESIFEVVEAFIAEFGEEKFVLGPSAAELAWFLPGGMEAGLMFMAMQPEKLKKIYMSKVASANAHDKYYVRRGQSGVLWGTDLASQKGPMISPRMYGELFLEGFSQRVASVKVHNQRVIKHMCGNNWPILDLMVQAGIECYQSVQQSAGMDIAEVYAGYNDKFAVWGGLPVELLIGGSRKEVRNAVRKVMTELAPNGRFIFGTSHSVAVGTNYENFMAMIDELHKWI
ncbi:methylcobalamin:coenzyme M methyltransferase [Limihaloglobus sulfuriphilus]|uniref:Methylcobalamin:coenzyme M methyltransferase n=1 Tax=Limihaloglobus sulfuriphilus TaxID=1851148 RepID=A0A1Q2MDT8_9BACT|nr:uroporphyrinogen decarboxylase family protein [Limihaloglobus sulfuriphilus]AQQ70477.1 methylcobalamin:coenzyme M methyltransferase [Limihaloglobus sulfuriphilus]